MNKSDNTIRDHAVSSTPNEFNDLVQVEEKLKDFMNSLKGKFFYLFKI